MVALNKDFRFSGKDSRSQAVELALHQRWIEDSPHRARFEIHSDTIKAQELNVANIESSLTDLKHQGQYVLNRRFSVGVFTFFGFSILVLLSYNDFKNSFKEDIWNPESYVALYFVSALLLTICTWIARSITYSRIGIWKAKLTAHGEDGHNLYKQYDIRKFKHNLKRYFFSPYFISTILAIGLIFFSLTALELKEEWSLTNTMLLSLTTAICFMFAAAFAQTMKNANLEDKIALTVLKPSATAKSIMLALAFATFFTLSFYGFSKLAVWGTLLVFGSILFTLTHIWVYKGEFEKMLLPDIFDGKFSYLVFYDLIGFRPFSFGVVWWWMLFIGLAVPLLSISEGIVALGSTIDVEYVITTVLPKIFPAIVVSLVAYIAENLISELLSTKNRLNSAAIEFSTFSKSLHDANTGLSHTLGQAKETTVEIQSMTEMIAKTSVVRNIFMFLNSIRRGQKIRGRHITTGRKDEMFLDFLSSSAANFEEDFELSSAKMYSAFQGLNNRNWLGKDRTTGHSLKFILPLLLPAFASTISQGGSVFGDPDIDDPKSIQFPKVYGDWIFLSSIVRNLIKSINESMYSAERKGGSTHEVEFFTLLVMPPSHFIEKGFPTYRGQGADVGTVSDQEEWREFLNENVDLHEKVSVKRHFLMRSITPSQALSFALDDISTALSVKRTLSNLNYPVKKGTFSPVLESQEEESERQTLGDIIDKHYHAGTSSARIIDIKNSTGVSYFFEENKIKNEKNTSGGNRLKDYFAVRIDGVWVMCLKSYIHMKSGMAEVEICYDMDKRGNCKRFKSMRKNELDVIFIRNSEDNKNLKGGFVNEALSEYL